MFSKIEVINRLSRRIWKTAMGQNIEADAVRRCRGRPQVRSDEVTRGLIIEAARQEFQANGYAATSIANVARRASVSTKTLYRLIPTKAELFRSVVSERIGRFVLALERELSGLDSLMLSRLWSGC